MQQFCGSRISLVTLERTTKADEDFLHDSNVEIDNRNIFLKNNDQCRKRVGPSQVSFARKISLCSQPFIFGYGATEVLGFRSFTNRKVIHRRHI